MQTFKLPIRAPKLASQHSIIKSFIKMLKRKGERMPPCFTPQLMINRDERMSKSNSKTAMEES